MNLRLEAGMFRLILLDYKFYTIFKYLLLKQMLLTRIRQGLVDT